MPQVPTYDTPQTQAQNPQPAIADYGAGPGPALARAGGQISQASAGLLEAIEGINTQIAANDAYSKLMQRSQEVTFGTPDQPGYLSLRGQDAVNRYLPAQQHLEDYRNQLSSQLPAQARVAFDNDSRRFLTGTIHTLGTHFVQQQGVALDQSSEALIRNDAQNAVANYTDPSKFNASLADQANSIRLTAARNGWSEDQLNAKLAEQRSLVYRAVTERIEASDPLKANEFYQSNRANLTGLDQLALDQKLAPKVRLTTANNIADANVAGTGALAIGDAIHHQESGGQATSPTSVNGARGGWQITPPTFQQYALPGENIDNPADNEKVGRRIVADLSGRYGGDPARVAVAYFSGPGNVAPPDSPTPWITDKADGNGTRTSSYVAGVLRSLPRVSTPDQPASVTPMVIGDSIAVGVNKSLSPQTPYSVSPIGGKEGATPEQVLTAIGALPPGGQVSSGAPVILSTGLSNDPSKLETVQQQIEALKARGATDIRLLGVGSRPDLAPLNAQLQQIAARNQNVTFTPLPGVGPDQVHPTVAGYQALAQGLHSTPAAQSPADFYRAHFEQIVENTRAQAETQFPGDPAAVELSVSRAATRMRTAITAQEENYRADRDLVMQTLNGDPSRGIPGPATVEGLTNGSQAAAAAWQRIQTQQPAYAHDVLTRLLPENAKAPAEGDAKTYGPGFVSTFQRIHLPDGDPDKITSDQQLLPLVGSQSGLTMAGLAKARDELNGKRTPEGEADSALRAQAFKWAQNQLSGKSDALGIPDPKGEELYLRWMAGAYKAIDAGRARGLTSDQLFNPDSPDFIGKSVGGLKRSPAQLVADINAATAAAPSGSTTPSAGIPPPPDLTTPQGIAAAVRAGTLDRDRAMQLLTGGRTAAAPAAPAPAVPVN